MINFLRSHEVRMCKTKRVYRSEKGAQVGALRSCLSFEKPMRVYHCPYCKQWHLTSQVEDIFNND